jgi:phage baseplate assembly protein W
MKPSEFKKLIKESVREAIQEELKDILLEAIKSNKQPITESYQPDTRTLNFNTNSIPHQISSTPKVIFQTYTTQDAIRNNLLNFFLTNQTERYLNNQFGANLRAFIFEQISTDNISDLKENIQSLLSQYFVNIKVDKLEVLESPDNNEITVQLYYSIINTGITDQVQISFT